jgi:hypothetical protein
MRVRASMIAEVSSRASGLYFIVLIMQ